MYIGMIERGQAQHVSENRMGVTLCGIEFRGYYQYKRIVTCPECEAKLKDLNKETQRRRSA